MSKNKELEELKEERRKSLLKVESVEFDTKQYDFGLKYDENLFGTLWPYIQNDDITDIKWNGQAIWINDIKKGRYIARDASGLPIKLSQEFIHIFCTRIANSVNENFNISEPSLKAETPELRIQAEHGSVSGDGTIAIAIRKTPKVSRLAEQNLVENKYLDELIEALLPCLMKARLSGIVTGDVGAGKTELIKYLIRYIPNEDGIITVEDTLEMKATGLYPEKDIYSMRTTDAFTPEMAIVDALRLLTKWLILAEARGREVNRIIEGASTGCRSLCAIHAEHAWEIPDRIINMAGENARSSLVNDVYTFFDYAIKVNADVTSNGIHRYISEIVFFDRDDNEDTNKKYVIYREGKLTDVILPKRIQKMFMDCGRSGKEFLNLYKNKYEELKAQKKLIRGTF